MKEDKWKRVLPPHTYIICFSIKFMMPPSGQYLPSLEWRNRWYIYRSKCEPESPWQVIISRLKKKWRWNSGCPQGFNPFTFYFWDNKPHIYGCSLYCWVWRQNYNEVSTVLNRKKNKKIKKTKPNVFEKKQLFSVTSEKKELVPRCDGCFLVVNLTMSGMN